MNAIKVYKRLCAAWPKLGFEMVNGSDSKKCEFTASIVAANYFDDSVFVEGTIYASGSLHVFMTFDHIDPTLEVYDLINEFNEETSWAKAYIKHVRRKDGTEGRYLALHYSVVSSKNDKEACENLSFCFNNMLNDSVMKYLKPLTILTYK